MIENGNILQIHYFPIQEAQKPGSSGFQTGSGGFRMRSGGFRTRSGGFPTGAYALRCRARGTRRQALGAPDMGKMPMLHMAKMAMLRRRHAHATRKRLPWELRGIRLSKRSRPVD